MITAWGIVAFPSGLLPNAWPNCGSHGRPTPSPPHLFIEHYNRKFKRNTEGVTESAANLLLYHDWPGNVRELRNAIERAMILEESSLITPPSLPIAISRPDGDGLHETAEAVAGMPVDGMSLEDNERSLLVRALEKTNGNQTQAARLLRVTRDTLRYKMKKFNLR